MDKHRICLLFLAILVALISIQGCAVQTTESAMPYPDVEKAYPLTNPTMAYPVPNQVTAVEQAILAETQSAAFAATMTAFPRPTLTTLPTDTYSEDSPVCYIDPFLGFSLMVAPGWYASTGYDPNTAVSSVTLFNYDYKHATEHDDIFSKGGMKVTLDVLDLPAGTDFDQYVQDRTLVEQQAGPIPSSVTEPINYTLGAYSGVTFTISGYDLDVIEIILQSGNRIAIVGLMPANSPASSQALSILSSLDLFNSEACNQ